MGRAATGIDRPVAAISQVDSAGPLARRLSLAGVLRVVRAHKGWSVEEAAQRAESNHVSWRRMEAGTPVRAATYGRVEQLFHLHHGAVLAALGDDKAMVDLALQLGVGEVEIGETATKWVTRFALAFGPKVELDPIADVIEPTMSQAADLVSRFAAERNRSQAKEDALQALLRVMSELASAS